MICAVLLTSCYKSLIPKPINLRLPLMVLLSVAEIGQQPGGYGLSMVIMLDSVSNTPATGVNTSFTGGFKGQALQGSANGMLFQLYKCY